MALGVKVPIISELNSAGFKAAIAEFKKLETRTEKFQFLMKKATSPAGLTVIAGAALAAGKAIFDMANEAAALGETQNKVDQIFQASAKQFDDWSEKAAKAFGQSKQQALDGVSTFGIFGRSAGLTGDSLVAFSKTLTELAADLASFNNTTVDDALTALGAGLRGESEPLRRFGVLLDDATLRQSALRQGIIDTVDKALTPQQRVLAAYYEILRQTNTQQGDFARTSDSLANQQRILGAETKNLKTELGQKFQPIVKDVTSSLIDLVDAGFWVGERFTDLNNAFEDMGDATLELASQLPGLGFLWNETKDGIDASEDSAINAAAAFSRLKNELVGVYDALYYGREPLNWMTQIGLPNLNAHLEDLGFDTAISEGNGFGASLREQESDLERFMKAAKAAGDALAGIITGYLDLNAAAKTGSLAGFVGSVSGQAAQIKNLAKNLGTLSARGLAPQAIQGIMSLDLGTAASLAQDLVNSAFSTRYIRQLNTAYQGIASTATSFGQTFGANFMTGGAVSIGQVTVVSNDPRKFVSGLRQYARANGSVPIPVTGSL